MLDPKEVVEMFEDYIQEQVERQSELLAAQQEAANELLADIERVPHEQRLLLIERFMTWHTVPEAVADTAQWPVDAWHAQARLVHSYWAWARNSQQALLQFWSPRS